MKICPECGKVLSYNSYFGAYICTDCKWEDARKGEQRNKGYVNNVFYFKKCKSIKSTKAILAKHT